MSDKTYDLTIIGGGPVGMYASFYAAMQGLDVKLVESLEQLGGQLTAIYPEKFIYDLPGHKKVRASEIIDLIYSQMEGYLEKIQISTNATVNDVSKNDDGTFTLTSSAEVFNSRSVLITAGNGAFSPRKLEVTNKSIENIHYFVTDMNKFKDKKVVIFGGGDSAVDWALMLEDVAKEVTIVHRKETFRAHASSVDKLKASKVNILAPYKPTDISGENGIASKVVLTHYDNNEDVTLDVDDIVVLFGFVSNLGPIKAWGLELSQAGLTVDSYDQTNIPGIFAAGDAATFDGKVKMITAGFGEAIVAINAAKVYTYPDKKHRHQHSSNIGG